MLFLIGTGRNGDIVSTCVGTTSSQVGKVGPAWRKRQDKECEGQDTNL